RRAGVTMARQVDDVQAKVFGQERHERSEDAAVHRPAMDQDQVGAAAERVDMHVQRSMLARPIARASALSSCSTSDSSCRADSTTRKRALPCATVGGRIAGTKNPCASSDCIATSAALLAPT